MGTAIAQVVALNGYKVRLWNHSGDLEPLKQIKEKQENANYLPGVKLSKNIIPEHSIEQTVLKADIIFISVPSVFIAAVAKQAAPHLSGREVCVDVSKGLDEKSLSLTTDILKSILPKNKIAIISGPAVAKQMVVDGFTAMNVASLDAGAIRMVKKVMENKNLNLIPTTDIVGVEAAGSFKNVYAIAVGMCDGLCMSTNTKAILFVTALQEMSLLIKKMGGRAETVYGLAGLGDLIGTGMAHSSRNRRFGEFLAKGLSLEKATAEVGQVVEGVVAVKVLNSLAKKYKLKTPFANMVYKIICGKISSKTGLEKFLKNF
ncbi:MAG: Glycerol-3-phosphate dehydrogenase [NAD(P)+] [Candidatus Magasanikbacteria bacterium GW2011_GWA2_40_10]|uniref:Glycerol-3-phosphate dehydrogenase [NAD(P)+] n=1 Tax=Candidatus Magasanikbacteria bacterium GW2011_GWA2_40_10 TaxID=1619037 RepID=A0A0G0QDK7_9BACT|nr:MAG: Glycerol-3-phosphate dehydrogenase [NAD(P)+] [Candidatus Magasanikbacteria bacterium GW2011_GWA2_40_10]